jgi:hypothetical protein
VARIGGGAPAASGRLPVELARSTCRADMIPCGRGVEEDWASRQRDLGAVDRNQHSRSGIRLLEGHVHKPQAVSWRALVARPPAKHEFRVLRWRQYDLSIKSIAQKIRDIWTSDDKDPCEEQQERRSYRVGSTEAGCIEPAWNAPPFAATCADASKPVRHRLGAMQMLVAGLHRQHQEKIADDK